METSAAHLDLGCGKYPRNPYGRARLCGVDARPAPAGVDFEHRVANLALQPIPWPDNAFASVSAFDFIEHIPRLLPTPDRRDTTFPFINLMNEVWRVLAPGGRFYAVTPAFPHPHAFTDPTHVNFITDKTHEYFCGDKPLGRIYGFTGRFAALRVEWVHSREAYSATSRPPKSLARRLAAALRDFLRSLRGKPAHAYVVWELEAIK
jgi:SAM-dependent methyltransferase